jgi:hypothetical protein
MSYVCVYSVINKSAVLPWQESYEKLFVTTFVRLLAASLCKSRSTSSGSFLVNSITQANMMVVLMFEDILQVSRAVPRCAFVKIQFLAAERLKQSFCLHSSQMRKNSLILIWRRYVYYTGISLLQFSTKINTESDVTEFCPQQPFCEQCSGPKWLQYFKHLISAFPSPHSLPRGTKGCGHVTHYIKSPYWIFPVWKVWKSVRIHIARDDVSASSHVADKTE